MHSNKYWLAFLAAVLAITLGYVVVALWQVFVYYRYDGVVVAKEVQWSYDRVGRDKYALHAEYDYEVDGIQYRGATVFKEDVVRNPWAAERTVEAAKTHTWQVWYQKSAPKASTVERVFPTRQCVSAGAMVLLALYFVGLGYYVGMLKHRG